ncbi:ABC transporter permease [Pelagibacterium halotolerans]|uniref:Hydroxymethylpyrimidine ABC transporter, transmembrane component n=1 Tax=Pelagibacterium halotolerans (strain DSM 22347 / JCM 15775 / CGMCC 1.7692 / B2) TaxID=1082931 RepID=G4R659_PELHB|nr:ABC transporter permease [Pelagibacterium halotolerans]AEQ52152.1 hydroxymethylpyrimidine ABC transporter, transmembrane component [Pelagibacterium halotolerans B2]QJR18084.1 ABC transporter permease [Pelagibacterium halotolerans]SDZ84576.1 NitT/TauT family transport system permease protein [Pelagibacterium halotolerans]
MTSAGQAMTAEQALVHADDASATEAFVARERAKARRGALNNRLMATGFGLFVLAVWAFVTETGMVHALIIPSPVDTFWATGRVMSASYFWPNVWVTLSEIAWGFFWGLSSGVLFGVGVAMFPFIRATIYPYLVALQAPPKIVLAPIFITWFGFDQASKIAIAAVMSFFPMFLNTLTGLASVDPNAVRLMKSLTAGRWKTFRYLLLPNALPIMMAGVKLCWTLAVLGVIVGEFVGASAGIGYLIYAMNFQLDIAGVFSLIILLSVFTLAVYQFIEWLESRIVFWQQV